MDTLKVTLASDPDRYLDDDAVITVSTINVNREAFTRFRNDLYTSTTEIVYVEDSDYEYPPLSEFMRGDI